MVAHGLQNAFETIGHFESAKTWAYKSIELSLPLEDPQFIVVLQTTLFYLFEEGHYAQAYNVLNHIESFFSKVKEKINKGENVSPVLVSNLSNIGTNDTILYFFLLLPIAFFFSKQIIDGKLLPEEYQKEIDKAFANGNFHIKDLHSYGFAKQIFENIIINRINLAQFQEKIRAYSGEYGIIFHHIGYILLSTFSEPVQAANLQLEMIVGLDPFLGGMKGFNRFLMVPYFEFFWKHKFEENPQPFEGRQHLREKGFLLIERQGWNKKAKTIFRVLSNHLSLNLSSKLEDFIQPE